MSHPYTLFDHADVFYLQTGLTQIWFNPNLVADTTVWNDPPRYLPRVIEFMSEHHGTPWAYTEAPITGSPTFAFKDAATRATFIEKFELDRWGPRLGSMKNGVRHVWSNAKADFGNRWIPDV